MKIFARVMCVYVLIACSSKNLRGIAQLDVGYVTVCSAEIMKIVFLCHESKVKLLVENKQ